ncbi:hypothetical protein, partial [Novosphingobium sp. Fuku2-ISO-50]|uniref:hypothetical protein n=1 Tax=Novosphingobium sp. Fuku2-ISO-50 TaxID=1739114 RepID=UPI00076D0BC8
MKRPPLSILAILLALVISTPAQAAPVVAAIASALFVSEAAIAVATVVMDVALAVGMSLLINALFGPKTNRQAAVATLAIGEQPRTAILGICAVQGTLE